MVRPVDADYLLKHEEFFGRASTVDDPYDYGCCAVRSAIIESAPTVEIIQHTIDDFTDDEIALLRTLFSNIEHTCESCSSLIQKLGVSSVIREIDNHETG